MAAGREVSAFRTRHSAFDYGTQVVDAVAPLAAVGAAADEFHAEFILRPRCQVDHDDEPAGGEAAAVLPRAPGGAVLHLHRMHIGLHRHAQLHLAAGVVEDLFNDRFRQRHLRMVVMAGRLKAGGADGVGVALGDAFHIGGEQVQQANPTPRARRPWPPFAPRCLCWRRYTSR